MILRTEKDELYELLKAFYKVTGIKAAVYDTNLREILSYPENNSNLCNEIRKQYKCRCDQSNEKLFAKCKICDDVVINKCHAGLTEAAMPRKDKGIVIGYIMYGQIISEQCDKHECEFYKKYGRELISDIKHYSEVQLIAVSKIFNAITSYIILKKYIYAEDKPIIYLVMEYIGENLSEDLSVSRLCEKFNVSRAELYKLSKTSMPNGIAEFIKSFRLCYAAELLNKTNEPMWKIAEMTGFKDKQYFLRVFKMRYGISAGEYRKKCR